jgi:hypothetical protein
MPLLNVENRAGADPFAEFATTAEKGGQSVTCVGEAADAAYADFTGLLPGMPYVFRLIGTNPAGTTKGKNSKPILTIPAAPPAPTFLHAKASSIFIRFPENSRNGKQVVNKLTIGVAKAGPADPFASKNKPGAMSDASPNAATLKQARIQKLAPGCLYVFRLTVSNAAGKAVGAVSAPMLTVPGPPSRLREDSKHRKDDQVMLKFSKHGQHLTHLMIQYAILQGSKMTFDQLMKKDGSKTESIPNPQTATSMCVKGLTGNSKYVFRLAAKNKSGHTIGTVLGPITTVEHAPEMLDKSGWMTEVPAAEKKKGGLARRLSSKSAPKGNKYWYVIDGRLLNWFSDIKMTDEVGFLHLSKLKRITYVPDKDGQARVFSLLLKTGQKVTLECASSDPNMTTHDYTMGWMSSIQKALSGMQKSMAEFQAGEAAGKKEGRRASIQAASEDDLDDGIEDENAGFDEEEEGFGDEAEDTFAGDFGGFGEGGDDDDFGGGGDEEEDDEFGGGGDDEEEDDDFGGGGDFGGFDAEVDDGEMEEGETAFGEDFGDEEDEDGFGGFE